VADFHTGFNIVLALLFFPLLKPFARLLVRAPFAVYQSDQEGSSRLFATGLYRDRIVSEGGSARLSTAAWVGKYHRARNRDTRSRARSRRPRGPGVRASQRPPNGHTYRSICADPSRWQSSRRDSMRA
jgi:hypothetical protein